MTNEEYVAAAKLKMVLDQKLGRETPDWVYRLATNKPRFEVQTRPMGRWWNRKYFPQIWDNDLNDWYPGAYVGAGCGYEIAQEICNSLNGKKAS